MDASPIISWFATIASAIIVCGGQLMLTTVIKRWDRKQEERDQKTQAEREARNQWRKRVDSRLSDIEDMLGRSVASQASQTRSDIIHKCHRYLDDLGMASSEEKNALYDEHRQYAEFCKDLDIENNFIDMLVQRVMDLPERES